MTIFKFVGHSCWLKKTGQSHMFQNDDRIALDDGFYQMGISHLYTPLTAGQYSGTTEITVNSKTETKSNNCVLDERTGLIWSKGPSDDVGPSSDGKLYWDNHVTKLEHTAPTTNFSVGALLTQLHSGATAMIRYANSGSNILYVEMVDGAFTTNPTHTITDDDGGGGSCYITSIESANKEDIWEYLRQARQEQFAGHSDWRIPTIHELMSIMLLDNDSGDAYPSSFFDSFSHIWSSCGRALHTQTGINAVFDYGRLDSSYKAEDPYPVLLVRGPDLTKKRPCLVLTPGGSTSAAIFPDALHYDLQGDLWPTRSFEVKDSGQYSGTTDITVNGKTDSMSNEVVVDNRTDLMWTRYCSDSVGPSSDGALEFCDGAGKREDALEYVRQANYDELAGHSDWRLPNNNEIVSIALEYENHLDSDYFEDNDVAFWSSTGRSNDLTISNRFTAGASVLANGTPKTGSTPYNVRLVRGGHTDDDL